MIPRLLPGFNGLSTLDFSIFLPPQALHHVIAQDPSQLHDSMQCPMPSRPREVLPKGPDKDF